RQRTNEIANGKIKSGKKREPETNPEKETKTNLKGKKRKRTRTTPSLTLGTTWPPDAPVGTSELTTDTSVTGGKSSDRRTHTKVGFASTPAFTSATEPDGVCAMAV